MSILLGWRWHGETSRSTSGCQSEDKTKSGAGRAFCYARRRRMHAVDGSFVSRGGSVGYYFRERGRDNKRRSESARGSTREFRNKRTRRASRPDPAGSSLRRPTDHNWPQAPRLCSSAYHHLHLRIFTPAMQRAIKMRTPWQSQHDSLPIRFTHPNPPPPLLRNGCRLRPTRRRQLLHCSGPCAP